MDTLDKKQQAFEERLDAIARRSGWGKLGAGDDSSIKARLRAYEARLDARIAAHRRRTETVARAAADADSAASEPRPELPPLWPGQPRIALDGKPALKQLDRLFAAEFDLDRYFPDHQLGNYPTVYAETLEEFYQPYLDVMDASDSTKEAVMSRLKAQAEEEAEEGRGGVFGIFWPGRGCYVNGWLFAHAATAASKGERSISPREALSDPQILPRIMATTVHEKQGHGFISEMTALGEEKQRLGVWRYDVARRFDLRAVDTPAGALLEQKEAVVYQSSQLLEEGWSTWIEDYMMARWATLNGRPEPEPRYTLEQAWNLLSGLERDAENPATKAAVRDILTGLRAVFLAEEPALEDIHRAVLVFHRHDDTVDETFSYNVGRPFEYVVGYLLLRKMEARLGALCLPYAVIIAANVTYGLEEIAASDLQHLVARNSRVNADARLAQLSLLDLEQKGDVKELAGRAHEELNLAVPSSLQI